MIKSVEKALVLWGFRGADFELIARRENQVFRIDHDGQSYAMRLRRPGYRTFDEITSELQWMDAVGQGGLAVPRPVPSTDGSLMQEIDGVQVDVLTWLSGKPLGAARENLALDDRLGTFRNIGREMARLHSVCDDWSLPTGFTRPAWDREGLVGENPIWGRFWENPTLSIEERELFLEVRDRAVKTLHAQETELDYGLIHADLVRENILMKDGLPRFIDFDDGGFGFRLFDLATCLMPNLYEEDFPSLKAALLEGYQSTREIDLRLLDLFMVLRSATYLGWIISRMNETGSAERNARFLKRTKMLAVGYLESDD